MPQTSAVSDKIANLILSAFLPNVAVLETLGALFKRRKGAIGLQCFIANYRQNERHRGCGHVSL